MRRMQAYLLLSSFVIMFLGVSACQSVVGRPYNGEIRIGHLAPFTGAIPLVAQSARETVRLWLDERGETITLNGTDFTLIIIERDNQTNAEEAARQAQELIEQEKVLAILGPYASSQAIPAAEVANQLKTPLISPWSTNPQTTLSRPFVFRVPFLDNFQAKVLVDFVKNEMGYRRVAVLYDEQSAYPKDIAHFFKGYAEEQGLSVVFFESFNQVNLSNLAIEQQLQRLNETDAEVLFLPQYYNEVPLIVGLLTQMGWDRPILGSDSWTSQELLASCGVDCDGFFFSTHWSPTAASEYAQGFIDLYQARYKMLPDDIAALTWDAMDLLALGIRNCGRITGNLEKDRDCIRAGLAKIDNFEGVTGTMRFDEEGNPIKCVVLARIENQAATFYKTVCSE